MGQQPDDRLDEDMEIDSDTAENVSGGVSLHLEVSKLEDSHKHPLHEAAPEAIERF
jgi:hypothetical protein